MAAARVLPTLWMVVACPAMATLILRSSHESHPAFVDWLCGSCTGRRRKLTPFIALCRPARARDAAPGVEVVVAANDMPVGAKVAESDVKLVRFSAAELPSNMLSSEDLGRGPGRNPSHRAEENFSCPTSWPGENAGSGMPSLIPPGMRAVSVRVNEVIGVAGFVVPGTRVDVLLTGNPSGAPDQQTTTVLENVAVIATGQKLERNTAGEPQLTPVITLLVSPG